MIYKTRILKPTSDNLKTAADYLKRGELVAIPTETVYGLAANALDENAVAKIFKTKGRPQDNPLIIHIANADDAEKLVSFIPEIAKKLMAAFWPGPLTLVFNRSNLVPSVVSAGLDTVAIRQPAHDVARKIINLSGLPLAAPSANISGSPSPTSATHVFNDLEGKIPIIIDGGHSDVGIESTVLDVTKEIPELLRPGGITPEMIREVAGKLLINDGVLNDINGEEKVASPGMRYKHYSPKAKVVLVKGKSEDFINFVNSETKKGDKNIIALCFDGEEKKLKVPAFVYGSRSNYTQQAQNIFDVLRKADEASDGDFKNTIIYCASPMLEGIGLAVYNRLLRAASFDVINV